MSERRLKEELCYRVPEASSEGAVPPIAVARAAGYGERSVDEALKALYLTDDPGDVQLAGAVLQEAGIAGEVRQVETKQGFVAALQDEDFDLILADYALSMFDGLSALAITRREVGEVPFIFVSGSPGEELAVNAFRSGATDYVLKRDLHGLVSAVKRALDSADQRSQRRSAEETLTKSEQKYRELFDHSLDAMHVADVDGTITDVNDAMLRLFGYTRDEVIGLPQTSLYADPGDGAEVVELLKKNRLIRNQTLTYRAKDGSELDCLLNARSRLDRGGNLIGYQGIIRDTAEQKQLQEQLIQAQKMEAIGQLAGGVAHDFNNILTGISGYSTLVLRELEKESRPAADLQHILDITARASSLTRQLLAFSRRQTLQTQVLNINDLIEQTTKMIRRMIGENVKLTCLTMAEPGTVRADPGQIEQVLLNLSINAADAMPDGGSLVIETCNLTSDGAGGDVNEPAMEPGDYVVLAVSDIGAGMDDKTRNQAFEPFFTTKDPGRGTGLGLSTVYGIVKQHRGHISLRSEKGKGTRFEIYLPLADADLDERKRNVPTDAITGSETILLVEDELMVREATHRGLELFGYEVISSSSPKEAVTLFTERGPDIAMLITDIVMPEMDGPALYERLAEQDSQLRVLFMSGYAEKGLLRKGIVDRDVPLLSKPFSPAELARKAREVLDG